MATNYGFPYMPSIVRTLGGDDGSDRTTIDIPIKNSTTMYLGQFVSDVQGTQASPTGPEFGAPGYTAHNALIGFVVGFRRRNGILPIIDDSAAAGTITAATGNLPYTYASASTNDESNTTSAILEVAMIMPILNSDILRIPLWGASTAPVTRGTTTAAGTTGSSDNIGIGLSVNATYPFSLLESGASKSLTSQDFETIAIDGMKPRNPYFVYVRPLRAAAAWFPTLN